MNIEEQLKNLKSSIEDIEARLVISDKSVDCLRELYSIIWIEACYDSYNKKSQECAIKCLPHIKALNEELRFKK